MGTVAALAVAAALALGGGAHASRPIVFGSEASNQALAEKQAEAELRSVRVPPGASRVDQSPAPILDEPLGTSGEPNLVERSEWLVAPGTVAGTLAWFRRHPPARSRIEEESRRGGGETAASIWFGVRERSRRVYGPSMIPIVTALGKHRVGIRLEIQQIWKTPHPAAAKVPAKARILFVSRRLGGDKPTWQVIRSVRRVRQVAQSIDLLPAKQPQILYGCEEFPRRRTYVRLVFKAHKGGPPLADASQQMPAQPCEAMEMTVAGRTFELEDGATVIELLHR